MAHRRLHPYPGHLANLYRRWSQGSAFMITAFNTHIPTSTTTTTFRSTLSSAALFKTLATSSIRGQAEPTNPTARPLQACIAAEANNVGVAGVAYNATLTGVLAYDFEYLGYSGQTALDYVQQAMAWAAEFRRVERTVMDLPSPSEMKRSSASAAGIRSCGYSPSLRQCLAIVSLHTPDRPAWKRRPGRTQRPWEHLRRLRRQRPSRPHSLTGTGMARSIAQW